MQDLRSSPYFFPCPYFIGYCLQGQETHHGVMSQRAFCSTRHYWGKEKQLLARPMWVLCCLVKPRANSDIHLQRRNIPGCIFVYLVSCIFLAGGHTVTPLYSFLPSFIHSISHTWLCLCTWPGHTLCYSVPKYSNSHIPDNQYQCTLIVDL